MGRIGCGWALATRARRRLRRSGVARPDWVEEQLRWIRASAAGRSFADIGGLFSKEGDIAFAAEEAGARKVTCFDAGDPDLCGFANKRDARGSAVRFVQGDLEDPDSVAAIGPHDIVWCTGVLYHSPNPVRQLMCLREITRELLYLGTLTIPEVPGFPQACIYYPYLDESQRRPYAAGYRWAAGLPQELIGIGTPFREEPMLGHANCWWGISPSALRAMLRTARFEVVEERPVYESPYVTEVVARPLDADPVLPPLSYFRERGRLRERSGERMPFEDYFTEQRSHPSGPESRPRV
jgi:hypothetical protein